MITRTLLSIAYSVFGVLTLNSLLSLLLAAPSAWLWNHGPALAFHLPIVGYWPAVATLTLAKLIRLSSKAGMVSIKWNS